MAITGFRHAVTWRQFRPVRARPGRAAEDAFIKAKKNVSYDYAGSGRSYRVTAVRARIWVQSSECWVVEGTETAYLLRHEQGHFDITALGMREEATRVGRVTGTP